MNLLVNHLIKYMFLIDPLFFLLGGVIMKRNIGTT